MQSFLRQKVCRVELFAGTWCHSAVVYRDDTWGGTSQFRGDAWLAMCPSNARHDLC